MKCPQCGAWSQVLETRGTRRRRLCANEHRFTTAETVVPDKRGGEKKKQNVLDAVENNATFHAHE